MSNTNSDSEALTPAEFAKRTGLSLGYVYSQLCTGKLHATKAHGQWAIPTIEVERRRQRREAVSA
jgi:hypothetical protein